MDHSDLVEELTEVEKLSPAERIAIARQRRAFQLLKWHERETAAEALLNGCTMDGLVYQTLYERKPKVAFSSNIMLLEATARNDMEEVRRLLDNGTDSNSHNEDGLTPLHQCAIDNNKEMLELLLEHGADVNARDTERWTPLHAAACCGHAAIVRRLIDRNASLLAVNADGNMPYDICDDEYTLDLIESEMAKRGITQGDIDDERLSPERNMLDDLQMLREAGGDLEHRDAHGGTPLHIASANGYYSCAQFLLDCGCSTDVRDEDGWQPVHLAASWAQADILELLVACGADINACTPTNETPLDLCDDEIVRALIMTLQVEAQRRLLSFGRDSRRMSKRRKPSSKFESPTGATTSENHIGATRGAIRRQSVRDRAGVTLARLEARKEAELLQRFGVDDGDDEVVKSNNEVEINHATESEERTNGDGMDSTAFGKNTQSRVENQLAECADDTHCSILTIGLGDSGTPNSDRGDHSQSPTEELTDAYDAIPSSNNLEHSSSFRAISTAEWLQKVRDEEEMSVSTNLERLSPDRKGRRKQPAPVALLSATNGTSSNPQNGPTIVPDPLYPDPGIPGRARQQTTSDACNSQHTRTLSPGEPSFSRHPMTLIDLKKQRAEERKQAPTGGPVRQGNCDGNAVHSTTVCNDRWEVSEGPKFRYRSPSDAFVSGSRSRSHSPKVGLRCCRIT